MKTIFINNNWLKDSDLRLDAAFHLSEGVLATHILKTSKVKCDYLKNLTTDVFMGPRFKRYYVSNLNNGVPFMGGSDMQKSGLSGLKLISKKMTKEIQQLYLKKGWILVTRSGTIGQSVFTNEDFEGKTATEDVIRIIADDNKIKAGYLYAYLSSNFGYALLTQSTYGAVIQHIEPHHLKNLPVPILPEDKQQQIHDLIIESSKLRVKSNSHLLMATEYFEKKYNISTNTKTVFKKNINDFDFSWTGRNNDIIIENHIKEIKEKEHLILSKEAEKIFAPPLFKHIYLKTNNGHPFYTGRQLSNYFRRPERFLSTKGVRNINDYKVNKEAIVIYKSGPRDGLIGSVFLVDNSIQKGCLSDHVIRVIVPDTELRNWVFAYLKSNIGKRILHNLASGTAILFITPERVGNIVVPKPDKNLEIISTYIDCYLECFERANSCELQAIELIENEISSWQK